MQRKASEFWFKEKTRCCLPQGLDIVFQKLLKRRTFEVRYFIMVIITKIIIKLLLKFSFHSTRDVWKFCQIAWIASALKFRQNFQTSRVQ